MKKLSILLILLFAALFFSCEKDLYEEPLRKKERPNLQIEMKPVNRNSEVINKIRKKLPSKFMINDYARREEILLTLEGDFGKVKLESVLEVANQNEKAYSFEVDETVKDPNKYLNLVIDKNDVIWLYKVEKLVQQYKNYPINSERLVKYKLNSDLTPQSSTPCDTIVYPPFQPDPIHNPSNGGGGITFPGGSNWQNNPPGGGFFPPIKNPGVSSGSSGSPDSGSNGVYEVIVAVGDAISDAWNWLINLFSSTPKPQSSGCGCKQNVVIVAPPDNPCGPDGYIAIIPQSPIIDKINELDAMLFDQLTYDDKLYLHNEGLAYLDYFYNLAQNPPVGYDVYNIVPELITHLRKTGDFEFTNEINELAMNETNQTDVNNLVSIATRLNSNSSIMFKDSFALTLDPYIDLDLDALSTPPSTFTPNLVLLHTYMKYRLLRQMNPTWPKAKCAWEASKEIIHLSLDAFGLIPVGGEVADLLNGVLYTIEGDGLNATLSYASAVPFVGWATAGTKFGIMLATTATGTTKFVWKMTNHVLEFGNRGQLRKVLNLAVGNPLVAHHIIPWAKSSHEVIQKAAKSADAFHMNKALNGIPLSTAVHNGSHAAYDQRVVDRLNAIKNQYGPNMTPQQAYDALTELLNDIRNAIQNNPNTPINQIVF